MTTTEIQGPKVGDIWDCSWGYDETRIEFYVVRRVSEHSIWLQRIGANTTNENGICRFKTPSDDNTFGEVIRRKLQNSRGVYGCSINSYKWAGPWSGEAQFDSSGSR